MIIRLKFCKINNTEPSNTNKTFSYHSISLSSQKNAPWMRKQRKFHLYTVYIQIHWQIFSEEQLLDFTEFQFSPDLHHVFRLKIPARHSLCHLPLHSSDNIHIHTKQNNKINYTHRDFIEFHRCKTKDLRVRKINKG